MFNRELSDTENQIFLELIEKDSKAAVINNIDFVETAADGEIYCEEKTVL